MKIITDFVTFAKQLKVTTKYGERVVVDPSPALLEYEAQRSSRVIVKKPRQVYMTTWELACDIWYAATHQDADVEVLVLHDDAGVSVIHQIRDLLTETRTTALMGRAIQRSHEQQVRLHHRFTTHGHVCRRRSDQGEWASHPPASCGRGRVLPHGHG